MARFYQWFFLGLLSFAFLLNTEACYRSKSKPPARYSTTTSIPETTTTTQALIEKILSVVNETLHDHNFEVYDFKVGWYNKKVEPKFELPYDDDTVAISTQIIPGVFPDTFEPFICDNGPSIFNNSWHQFTKYYMQKVQKNLMERLGLNISDKDIIYPGTMLGPGYPQIRVQYSSHVAGAAYYYQRKDIKNDPWPKNKTIYGASLHPIYGGWFFMGPVIILQDVKVPNLIEKPPKDVLPMDAEKIEFLYLANFQWRNQKWRNIIPVEKNYTTNHIAYSHTWGETRIAWLEKFYNQTCL